MFHWPSDGKLVVPGLKQQPVRAFLLTDAQHQALPITAADGTVTIQLPASMPDPLATVVVLDVQGQP